MEAVAALAPSRPMSSVSNPLDTKPKKPVHQSKGSEDREESALARASFAAFAADSLSEVRAKVPSLYSPAFDLRMLSSEKPLFNLGDDKCENLKEKIVGMYQNMGLLSAFVFAVCVSSLMAEVPDDVHADVKHTFVISQCAGTIALFMSTTATVMFCIMVNELNTNDEVKHWATVMGNSAKFMPVGFFMIGAFFTLFGILVWVFMQCGDVMTGWCIVACGPLLFVLPSLAVRKGAWALLMVHETANAIHKARKPSVVGADEIHATLAKYVLEEKASSVLEIEKDEFVSRVRVGLPAYDEWLATSESARSFEALAKRSFTTMTLKLVERIFDAYAEGQLEKMVGSLPLAELGDVTKTTAAAAGTPAPKTGVV